MPTSASGAAVRPLVRQAASMAAWIVRPPPVTQGGRRQSFQRSESRHRRRRLTESLCARTGAMSA
eukprot:scaffold96468_cov30-Tisochrysis_lutea.AAC.3